MEFTSRAGWKKNLVALERKTLTFKFNYLKCIWRPARNTQTELDHSVGHSRNPFLSSKCASGTSSSDGCCLLQNLLCSVKKNAPPPDATKRSDGCVPWLTAFYFSVHTWMTWKLRNDATHGAVGTSGNCIEFELQAIEGVLHMKINVSL